MSDLKGKSEASGAMVGTEGLWTSDVATGLVAHNGMRC